VTGTTPTVQTALTHNTRLDYLIEAAKEEIAYVGEQLKAGMAWL